MEYYLEPCIELILALKEDVIWRLIPTMKIKKDPIQGEVDISLEDIKRKRIATSLLNILYTMSYMA